jgi:hypothetical protein
MVAFCNNDVPDVAGIDGRALHLNKCVAFAWLRNSDLFDSQDRRCPNSVKRNDFMILVLMALQSLGLGKCIRQAAGNVARFSHQNE